jgi:SAM-dependent methyltransferase
MKILKGTLMVKEKNADITNHNKKAWDIIAQTDSPWTQPVSSQTIEEAKKGTWNIHLTKRPVPREWLSDIRGTKILCLASGGGQQGPVLASAGAEVVVFDLSEMQLAKDEIVAKEHKLNLKVVSGDMQRLPEYFEASSFDMVFNPISNLYIRDLKAVWKGCAHVLKNNGYLLASFYNPIAFVFKGDKPKHKIPFRSDKSRGLKEGEPVGFGHSLEEQIAGQIEAGFSVVGFYEDSHPNSGQFLIDQYQPVMIATRALLV